MSTALIILLAAGGLVGIYLIGWRLLSPYYQLPCPPGFIFLLESRLMTGVAGPQAIIQRARIEPGMRVLDAGCGPGRISIPVAHHLGPDGNLVALDIQEEMLSRLAKRIKDQGLINIEIVQGALGEGQAGMNRFDRVLLITVLGEIPDQAAALKEIHRALVPGGILSITEVLPDPHYQPRTKVHRLAGLAGFQTEMVYQSWRSYTINLIKSVELQT
jgi:ubiquinone/menaquinone biosynthesis C-methylase UbiE